MIDEDSGQKTALENVAEMADYANAVASLVVGHRRILVEGQFQIELADQMAAALHAQILGLVTFWQAEDEVQVLFHAGDEGEDDD